MKRLENGREITLVLVRSLSRYKISWTKTNTKVKKPRDVRFEFYSQSENLGVLKINEYTM